MIFHDIPVTTIDGRKITMAEFKGRTLLIVNVASECGFTPQYEGLEALYRKYRDRGLTVLGFPCNQFGHQEPGDEAEISRFCGEEYNITFPLFAKINVNGPATHPLYVYLKEEKPGLLGSGMIKWNFTKFVVGPAGEVLRRFAPVDTPEKIGKELEVLLP